VDGSRSCATLPAVGEVSTRSDQLQGILVEDYRQQCTNLQNQYTRMHGRMQLITGLNTALLPALGALAVAAGKGEVGRGWLFLFPAAGVLLSAVGYVAGSADRYLVDLYRRQLDRTAVLLVEAVPADERALLLERWAHAGTSPDRALRVIDDTDPAPAPPWWDRATSWRVPALSVTRLPATLSLLFIAVWLIVAALLAAVGV
jgi:hypothetical protein